MCVCCSVLSDCLWAHGLQPAGLLCPWDFPSKNTEIGCLSLLQGIFLILGSNPDLPYCRQILYHLSNQGSPTYTMCVCVCVYTNFSKFLSEMLEKWITINWDEDDHKSSSFRENFKKSGWYMLSLRSLLNIWVNRLSVHSDTGIRVQQTGVNAPGIQASPLLFPFPVALNNMYMLLKPKTIALVQTVCWLQIHIFNDENIWVATDIVKENSSFLPQI